MIRESSELIGYYSELFGIGGGVGTGPEGYGGHVTFYVEVPEIKSA
jgi:hypothetical protein